VYIRPHVDMKDNLSGCVVLQGCRVSTRAQRGATRPHGHGCIASRTDDMQVRISWVLTRKNNPKGMFEDILPLIMCY
jgi:hypothetical protein